MEEIKISWYTRADDTTSKNIKSLSESLGDIRTCKYQEKVDQYRKETNPVKRQNYKKALPGVTFAGTFSERKDDNLIHASGLACLDFDHLSTKGIKPEEWREQICTNDFILAAWKSPGGDGVKALARVPISNSKDEYLQYYEALILEVNNPATDPQNKNISRLCFISYDSEIHIKDFEKVSIFDKKITICTRPDQKPVTGKINGNVFNPILARMGARGEVYTIGNRETFIHNLACETNRAGIPEAQSTEFILSKFNELETRETIAAIEGVYRRNAEEFNKGGAELEKMKSACLVDTTASRPNEPTILSIDGQPVASLGSFTTTLGKAKARKTHHNTHQAAAFLKGTLHNHNVTLPIGKEKVIYFDTEQSGGEAWDAAIKISKTAGSNRENLIFYSLRQYTPEERTKFIDYIISTTPGLGIVFIDGIRDLVNNINDPNEATTALTALLRWSGEFQIHIFCTLHLNKSDNNARGHLGTELMNKSQTIINLEKVDDVYSKVSFVDGRGRGFKEYALTYDDDGLPISLNIEDVESHKPAKSGPKTIEPTDTPLNTHHEKLLKIFKDCDGLTKKVLNGKVQTAYGISDKTARRFIAYFIDDSLIDQDNNGNLYFKPIHQAKEI